MIMGAPDSAAQNANKRLALDQGHASPPVYVQVMQHMYITWVIDLDMSCSCQRQSWWLLLFRLEGHQDCPAQMHEAPKSASPYNRDVYPNMNIYRT